MFSQGNHPSQIRPPPFPQSQPNPPQLPPFSGPPLPLTYQPQYNNNMPPQQLIRSFFHQPTQTYFPPLKTPYSQALPPPPPRMPTLPPPPPAHLSQGNALYYTPPPPPPPPLREIEHVQVPCPPTLPPPPLPPLPPASPPPMPSPPPTQTSSGEKGLNDAANDTDDVLICTNDNEVDSPKNNCQVVAKESDDCKSEKCLSLEGQENPCLMPLEPDVMVTSHIDNIANRSPDASPVVSDMDMEDDVSEPIANLDDVPRKISAKEIKISSGSGDLGKIKTSPVPDRTDGQSESKVDYTEDVKCLPVLSSHVDSPVLASPDAGSNALDDSIHKSIKDDSPFCLIRGYASEEIEEKSESLNHTCPSNIEVVQEDEERNDEALNCEPSPKNCEKNSAKEGPPDEKHSAQEVDEFGRRRRRKDTIDSDSDDAHNKRRRNRRNVSRSRSPREKRSRRRSPSPRRREKRGRSRSWSPERSRQRNSLSRRGDKAQACMDFNRGKCYRGASCRFLHHAATHHTNKKQHLDIPLDSKLEKSMLLDMDMKECNDASKVDSTRTEKQHMGDKDVAAHGAQIIPPISSQEAINIVKESEADEALNVSEHNFVVEPQISVPSSTSCVPLKLNDASFHPYQKVFDQVEKAQISNAAEASKSVLTNEPLISVPSCTNFNNVNHQQTPPVPHSHPYIASDNPNTQFAASYQFQHTPSTYTYYPPVTNTFHSQSMVPHSLPLLPSLPNSHTIFPPRPDTNSMMRPHFFHSEQLQRPFLPVQEFRMEQLSMPELQKQQSKSEDASQSHFNLSSYTFDPRPTSADNDTNCISKNGTPNANISKEPTFRTSDAYDPLLDSINPDFQIHETCKADEFREAAVDAEVGIVENDSPQLIVENSKGDAKESESGTTKSKDSRSMKLFKSALADFVKEILRPSWRQGNISKEAFKTIVKKTVDKVAEAMPSSRIPKSQAKINQYVETSQQKLTKLVTGYVDKYVKM